MPAHDEVAPSVRRLEREALVESEGVRVGERLCQRDRVGLAQENEGILDVEPAVILPRAHRLVHSDRGLVRYVDAEHGEELGVLVGRECRGADDGDCELDAGHHRHRGSDLFRNEARLARRHLE